MSRVEDRLARAAGRLRSDIATTIDEADVDDALDRTTAGSRASAGEPAPRLLLVATVLAAVALGAVGLYLTGGEDESRLAADGSGAPTTTEAPFDTTTTPSVRPAGALPFEVVGEVYPSDAPVGSMMFAGVEDALVDRWTLTGSDHPVPDVDVTDSAVLAFTVSSVDRCIGSLDAMILLDGAVQAMFAEDDDCVSDVARTVVVTVPRVELPTTFTLVLDGALTGGAGEQRMPVDLADNFASSQPPRETTDRAMPDGPDLADPEPGRTVTFDGIGDVSVGDTLGPSEFRSHGNSPSCGYWGPAEPTHDGDPPPGGVVAIDDDRATIVSVQVRMNPRYRTASGVGVGTSLATLERIYGEDLVVDRADGWENPTDGLLASYTDVAAVRNGDRAITYHLHGDVISGIKVSHADFWGDDEGCA